MKYSLVNNDGSQFLTVFHDGELQTVSDSHPRFNEIRDGVLNGDDSVIELISVARVVAKRFEALSERVKISGSTVTFDGDVIDNSLTKQIVRFLDEGVEDFQPLVNYFEKVMQNPEPHSREQLYDWLDRYDVSINADGNFVVYKGVRKANRDDLTDASAPIAIYESGHQGKAIVNGTVYEGHIPQWVGAVVEMPRSEVHHDPSVGCSTGLHASSDMQTATGYAGDGTVLEVVINPRDVVSVPHDGVNKIRVSRYLVTGVDAVERKTAFVDVGYWGEDDLDDEDYDEDYDDDNFDDEDDYSRPTYF